MAARYTEDQRQQVLEMLRSNRFDVAHIARELGISRQTIYNWIDESGDENLLKMPNVSRMTRLTSQVAESHQSEPDYINDEAYLLSGLANPTRADAESGEIIVTGHRGPDEGRAFQGSNQHTLRLDRCDTQDKSNPAPGIGSRLLLCLNPNLTRRGDCLFRT
ncbi:MAG TPA: helix-turn-helix domain-containing protein [Aggregatilineales bacterium]|nr:helix-turn-helix domain-containing protein [Aggregatilineales bacterium]